MLPLNQKSQKSKKKLTQQKQKLAFFKELFYFVSIGKKIQVLWK